MYRQQNDTNQPHFEIFDKSKGYAGVELDSKLKTVQHNKEGFTPKQVKAAMDARSAMHMLGAPSIKNLKYAIRSGLIKNCPITEEALQHAEAIYGPDSSTLKGKSTKPETVADQANNCHPRRNWPEHPLEEAACATPKIQECVRELQNWSTRRVNPRAGYHPIL